MPKIRGKAKHLVHHDELVLLAAPKQFNPLLEVREPIEPPIRQNTGSRWKIDDLHFSNQILEYHEPKAVMPVYRNGKPTNDKAVLRLHKRKLSKLERKTFQTAYEVENDQPYLKPTRKKVYSGMPNGKFPNREELLKRAEALGLSEEEIAELI